MRDQIKVEYDDQDGYRGTLLIASSEYNPQKHEYVGYDAQERYKMLMDPYYIREHDEKVKNEFFKSHDFMKMKYEMDDIQQKVSFSISYETLFNEMTEEGKLNAILYAMKKAFNIS